MKKRADKEFLL
jgi:hypothetical protein